MAWLTGWSYRKSHVINYAAGAGTLYQKQITVHYGSGTDGDDDVYCTVGGVAHCKTDFGDIRFTDDDGSTELDYWMESKTNSDNAVFWVEVADSLESVAQTIYVYYGNTGVATTSNGANTFPSLFDDFNRADSATVGNGWTEDEDAGVGALSIDTNRLKTIQYQNYFCHIEKSSPAIANMVLQGKILVTGGQAASWGPMINVYWNSYDYIGIGLGYYGGYCYWTHNDINSTFSDLYTGTSSINTWYWFRVRVGSSKVYVDYSPDGVAWTNFATINRPASWNGNPSLIIVGKGLAVSAVSYPNADLDNSYATAADSTTFYVDDVFVRKFTDPEPTHGSWGSEETSGPIKGWRKLKYST